jgi:hypothetical protein
MKAAWVRLAFVAALFVGWLGYLGYLVAERPVEGAIVLSRPQFLVSDLDVIAKVQEGSGQVTVIEVLYAADDADRKLVGKNLTVANIGDCRVLFEGAERESEPAANGVFLLALQNAGPEGKDRRVVITPPYPGFQTRTPRIYPISKEVLGQYRQIGKN